MSNQKQDAFARFERLVMKTVGTRNDIPAGEFTYFTLSHWRKHHMEIERLVRRQLCTSKGWIDGNALLAALAALRKGTRG